VGATLRLQSLDGGWETLGVDRLRGIVAEGIEASSNPWGPDQMSFQVKASSGAMRPDLNPYTPIELEVDGLLCWAGRIREKPSTEREHSVSCQGWQYHFDDDVLDRVYVHTRLSDYVDTRQHLSASLSKSEYNAAGQVSAGDLGIQLAWSDGTVITQGARVGVLLDLGPDSTAKRLVVEWESSNNDATSSQLYASGLSSPPFGSGETREDAFSINNNAGASGTSSGTFGTARRYISFFMYRSAAGGTYANDVWFRLKSIKLFRATAYESGNASILKADTVVKDARSFAPLLNQADDYVTAGTFSIPEYLTQSYQSPKEVIEAVNAYENYRLKVGGADLKTLVYGVKPTAPL
jgi:hypothetical protein